MELRTAMNRLLIVAILIISTVPRAAQEKDEKKAKALTQK
jgi:hypothetical protein